MGKLIMEDFLGYIVYGNELPLAYLVCLRMADELGLGVHELLTFQCTPHEVRELWSWTLW